VVHSAVAAHGTRHHAARALLREVEVLNVPVGVLSGDMPQQARRRRLQEVGARAVAGCVTGGVATCLRGVKSSLARRAVFDAGREAVVGARHDGAAVSGQCRKRGGARPRAGKRCHGCGGTRGVALRGVHVYAARAAGARGERGRSHGATLNSGGGGGGCQGAHDGGGGGGSVAGTRERGVDGVDRATHHLGVRRVEARQRGRHGLGVDSQQRRNVGTAG